MGLDMDLDDWDTQEVLYIAFGVFGGLILFFSICCACYNRRRQQRKSVISAQSAQSNRFEQCTEVQPSVDDGNVFLFNASSRKLLDNPCLSRSFS